MGSFRRKLFLALFFTSWLSPFAALGWVKQGTTSGCGSLEPQIVRGCTEAITAVANTAVLNTAGCDNFTAKLSLTGAATSTLIVQGCTDATPTACVDLHTTALNGGTLYGYTHGGPLDFIRGRVITAVPGGGTITMQVSCAGSAH